MTSDMALFRQHLVRLRARRLEHLYTLARCAKNEDFVAMKVSAHQAELLEGLMEDLKLLDRSPAEFVRRNLQHESE
jgi:hypothetical protein